MTNNSSPEIIKNTVDYREDYDYFSKKFLNFFIIYPVYTIKWDDCDFGGTANHNWGLNFTFVLDGYVFSVKIGSHMSLYPLIEGQLKRFPTHGEKKTENYIGKIKGKESRKLLRDEHRNYYYKKHQLDKEQDNERNV